LKDYVKKEPAINYCYDDRVIEAFEAFFDSFPVIITREHLPALRAMLKIGGGRPLDEVIAAVEKEGEIRLWWDSNNWRSVDKRERALRPQRAEVVLD